LNPKAAVDANQSQRFLAFIVLVKRLEQNKTNSTGDFWMFPSPIFRSGALRQGFDKFYSVSFLARRSLVSFFLNPSLA